MIPMLHVTAGKYDQFSIKMNFSIIHLFLTRSGNGANLNAQLVNDFLAYWKTLLNLIHPTQQLCCGNTTMENRTFGNVATLLVNIIIYDFSWGCGLARGYS